MKGSNERGIEVIVAYIHGRVEAQIEGFSNNLGIPTSELTTRVATLLLGMPSRSLEDRMSKVPRKTSKAYKTMGSVEVASGSRGNTSRKGKKVTHPYWSKLTPEQRKKEMKRRMEVRRINAE